MNTIKTLEKELNRKKRITPLKRRIISGLPKVCLARLKLMTESYQQTEGEPTPVRRAKALSHILTHMPIGICDGELIVGDFIGIPGTRGAPILPEYSVEWLVEEMDTLGTRDGDKFDLSKADKKLIMKLAGYWKGRTVKERSSLLMPDVLSDNYTKYFDICNNELARSGQGMSHIVVAYEKLISKGLGAITHEVEKKLDQMDPGSPSDLDKIHFYRAILITHKAINDFATRYADIARELEKKEKRNQRKKELAAIADICTQVPAGPARNFHEALQSIWFIKIALMIEGHGYAFAPGRMDQYLFPFYRRDVDTGLLDDEKVKELIQCFYIKLNSITLILPSAVTRFFGGFPIIEALILGGVGRNGRDATNRLSHLFLEADGELSMQQPESVIRVHKNMPRDFLIKACEVARKCRGKLKFINDPAAISKLMNQGYDVEDARDYVLVGCHEPFVPTKSNYIPGAHINLAICLELALNNGQSAVTGKQIGPQSGDPSLFQSIEDILEAYRTQVAYFTRHVAQYMNVIIEAHAQVAPTPFQSSLVEGCLEKGSDVTRCGALYNAGWLSGVGAVNVGDSLAAIKKCVFEEHLATLPELLTALRRNFKGKKKLQQALIAAPKFGNDDDDADLLTRAAVSIFCDEWQGQAYQGGLRQPLAALNANTSGIPLGRAVGASADGREVGEPLADGGLSPAHGRNIAGPVATFNSVAKIDHVKMKCGSVLNIRFNPDAVETESALQNLADMLLTYCELGGYHSQFNFVSSEILINAQKNPDKYRDLLVRVSTWTAYFTELSTDVQNDIIKRIEMNEI